MKITLILLLITSFTLYCTLYWILSGDDIINDCRAEKLEMNGDMNSGIKGDLISLLQSRMDKCTTEQFWAVGVITGLTALLISENSIIQKRNLHKFAVALMFLSACGIVFVVHRHVSWFKFELALRLLLENETIAPKMLKKKIVWCDSLGGVTFYTIWILLTCAAGVIICCKHPSSPDKDS